MSTNKKIGGGITIYMGFVSLMSGVVGGLIGLGYWFYLIISNLTNFTWGVPLGIILASTILGFIGYALMEAGKKEQES